ncbi:MAG: DUF4369 domain-containing protein, partial [Bacteroidota bacterium]
MQQISHKGTLGFVAALFVCALMAAGCGSGAKQHADEFIIHGKLKNTNGDKVVLVQMKADSLKPIDSVKIDDNGEFRFSYKPAVSCFYMLKLAANNFITILPEKGETVEITGNSRQLANEYKVSGSAGSELLAELNTHTRMNYRKSDSLFHILEVNKEKADFKKKHTETEKAALQELIGVLEKMRSLLDKANLLEHPAINERLSTTENILQGADGYR